MQIEQLNKNLNFSSNSILIIGNGESILKNEIGEDINKFKNIIRINNYKISSYEKFLGHKTTIWFNGANQGLKTRKNFPDKIIVSIPSEILIKKKNINSFITKRIKTNQFECLSLETIKKYESKVGYNRLTTGCYSIMWALDNFKYIYIHGFDFFISSKGHYFDNKIIKSLKNNNLIKKGEKHNNVLEKNYIINLIKNKKISKLID